jgi:hypothetical protein
MRHIDIVGVSVNSISVSFVLLSIVCLRRGHTFPPAPIMTMGCAGSVPIAARGISSAYDRLGKTDDNPKADIDRPAVVMAPLRSTTKGFTKGGGVSIPSFSLGFFASNDTWRVAIEERWSGTNACGLFNRGQTYNLHI